jgi:predicted XRE-type DNA-binding protein
MHYTNSEFDSLFNKFNVEYSKKNDDETNLYTLCCHTELNYNITKFIKSKKAKQNQIVQDYDLKESVFDIETDQYIIYLFELLEDQKHLYKLLNSK